MQIDRYEAGTEERQKALKPLANGFFGILFGLSGDLDYYGNVMDLPHYSLKHGCCALCKCNEEGPLSWTNFARNAPWVISHWSRIAWHAWDKKSKCPLFCLPGSFSAMVGLDYMHSKYLGSDQFTYGNCLFLLMSQMMPSGDKETNLQTLWSDIKRWYDANPVPVRFRYLTKLSMFIRASGFPKLRGKAAEIRWFAGAMKHVWDLYMNPHVALQKRHSASVICSLFFVKTYMVVAFFVEPQPTQHKINMAHYGPF